MSSTSRWSATAATRRSASPSPPNTLEVSTYDRVASMLIATLIIVGLLVAVMFAIWLTQRALAVPQAVPVKMLQASGGEGALGTETGLEDPDVEQVQELIEQRQWEETLNALTETAATKLAHLETLESANAGAGGGGMLDRGPPGEGDSDVIPPSERWEIRYEPGSRDEYADQLDFFGIELGVAGGGKPLIEYANNLSAKRPARRSGPSGKEDRLYMIWRGGPLQRADRELLAAAGINLRGRILMQFYPPEIEQALARLEQAHAGNRTVAEIHKTVFGVRRGGSKYEFYVIEQQYRR